MQSTNTRGYAEVLSADGAIALLRLHIPAEADDVQQAEQLHYIVSQHDEVIYVSEESGEAAARFNRLTLGRASDTGSGANGRGREDFLATMPTHLPTIRGQAFDKLAARVAELSHEHASAHE